MRKFLNLLASVALAGALALTPCGAQTAKKEARPAPKTAVAAAEQCTAMTQAGTRCKRKAQAGSKFCWQHDPANKGKKKKT